MRCFTQVDFFHARYASPVAARPPPAATGIAVMIGSFLLQLIWPLGGGGGGNRHGLRTTSTQPGRRNRPAGRWLRQHNTGEPGERRGGRKPGTPNKPKGERAVIALEQAEAEVPASSGQSPVPIGVAHEPQRPDCLADDAVSCELVSAPNSLLTGKLTGNFANSGPQQRFPHLINELIQRLAAKFPTQRNREFLQP